MNLLTEAAYFLQTSKRRKDQYFLVNELVLEKEVAHAQLNKNDIVLEVGGGLGFLTRELLKHCKTIVIERDIRFIGSLQRLGAEVIHADALKIPFPKFDKFVSNIPYSVSLPLALKLLRSDFELGVMIIRKEFAKKLAAKPGTKEYGRASVIVQYYSDVEIKDKVYKSDFEPRPKAESRIILFKKRNKENPAFEKFVTNLFRQRRKKVKPIDKRPEQLTVDEFVTLFKQQKS